MVISRLIIGCEPIVKWDDDSDAKSDGIGRRRRQATVDRDCVMLLLGLASLALLVQSIQSFQLGPAVLEPGRSQWSQSKLGSTESSAGYSSGAEAEVNDAFDYDAGIHLVLKAIASSGIDDEQLPPVMGVISSTCDDYGMSFDPSEIHAIGKPLRSKTLPGVLGRVLLLELAGAPAPFDVESELTAQLKIDLSQRIDQLLAGASQPILLGFRTPIVGRKQSVQSSLECVIRKEMSDYGLREAVAGASDGLSVEDKTLVPSYRVELDGAMIETVDYLEKTHFDTSSLVVFDDLVDDDLRSRLLNVVNGGDKKIWNDSQGPRPGRWVRGGLVDVANDDAEQSSAACYGLSEDAIMDICYNEHPAIAEFESKLSALFPSFVVTRLPESVLGSNISPVTANAPTHGDSFEFHIDCDPLQVPPSPWADVFGRYPNRSRGRPRFVSCLLYLNEEWNEAFGAPTRFLDPLTEEVYDVTPKPGRCLVMDQDITHRVVAPTKAAGKKPRYSLVFKLILHPKTQGQEMKLSCGKEDWPEPILFGSANI